MKELILSVVVFGIMCSGPGWSQDAPPPMGPAPTVKAAAPNMNEQAAQVLMNQLDVIRANTLAHAQHAGNMNGRMDALVKGFNLLADQVAKLEAKIVDLEAKLAPKKKKSKKKKSKEE